MTIPLPLRGLVIGSILWWVLTTPLWHQDPVVVDFSPERTSVALVQLLDSGAIFPHIFASLRRVFVGLLAAIGLGVPCGILLGLSRYLDQATSALFQFIRMISPLSWMPIAVMVLGIGDLPVYFLLTIAAIWALILNTSAGVVSVDRRWLLLSKGLCATQWEMISQVIIPAIIPHLLTGIRLAIGVIWIVLVPAEMLGVNEGLGYYILNTRDRLAYSELMAVVLIIGLIGCFLDITLRFAQHRWIHHL
ncbi:ABC transporter permease [Cylindrospermopsis raciborskii S07]|uniref:ABC transporter permease n=2 Tax=Cylindrospermopsis raciborskii TaxID=77022 RepID=A0A853MBW5_9CYAN|nr:ABC transporter permease [Cylindrospermopsis raciborskii]BAZ91123.1 ABC transporter permease protein [Raphidiopsis curvata NIES-932]EFA69040.1 Nitrate transport permease [Cylindrospermopsis raciborskii CS-505]OBU74974.1 ABC transporter permease [Cylindrospermopsis raciborskii CS-505]OHY41673.1 ABC transporter permease [Cylindrospermopsis raciborskii CS-508]PNK02721.1 ABC transporter permease [Cylindrospermopsis raciborskii S14]